MKQEIDERVINLIENLIEVQKKVMDIPIPTKFGVGVGLGVAIVSPIAIAVPIAMAAIMNNKSKMEQPYNNCRAIFGAGQYEKAIECGNMALNQKTSWFGDSLDDKLHTILSLSYYKISNYGKSKEHIQKAIELDKSKNTNLVLIRGCIWYILGDINNARKDFAYVNSKLPKTDTTYEVRKELFDEMYKLYVDSFLNLSYEKRKLIVPVKEISELSQESMSVFDINNIPDIKFPVGHPKVKELYVGHPFIPNRYIPFEDHEFEFVEDRIREFCDVIVSLGAEEIRIESIHSTSENTMSSDRTKISGGGSMKVHEGNASYEETNNNSLAKSIEQKIQIERTYDPTKYPSLPEGLVWYNNESSWQRLWNQRMSGGLNDSREVMKTSQNRAITQSDIKTIEAEYKNLMVNVNGKFESEKNFSLSLKQDAELTFSIRFAPLGSLKK
jgi:hypothetical protein